MAERLQVGPVTRCEGLLPYGNIIEHGALVVSVFLIGVWGGLLVLTLRQSPFPRTLLKAWCRNWMMPLLVIVAGMVLIGNGSHSRAGRWLDGADMWLVRFVMDSRYAHPEAAPSVPASVPSTEATLLHCPGTYAGLEVQGCMP